MSTTDERVSDLLARRAGQGSGVHPSLEGVDAAVARRAARRRRHRAVGGATGAVVAIALIAGAVAVSGGDNDTGPAPVTQDVASASLPLVGVDLVGFVRDPSLDPEITPSGPDLTYAAFTGGEPDVLGPMMTASLQVGDLDPVGTPVDLDVDGSTDGAADGWLVTFPDGAGVSWTAEDRTASINGHGVPADVVVDYAQQLSGQPFDLDTMPAPVGLENREVVTFEPIPDFASRVASYRGPSTVVHVLTTSDPGYLDLSRIVSTEGTPYEEIELGQTFLGPGQAIFSPDDDGVTSALVRTEAGLTVHVFGQGVDTATLRTAIQTGHLVELDPAEPPTTTTAPTQPQTTTTTVVTSTSIADQLRPLPNLRRTVDASGEHLTLEFDGFQPALGTLTLLETLPDACDRFATDFEELWRDDGEEPYWQGWLTIELESRFVGIEGPVFGGDGYILCTNDDAGATVAIPVAELGEPRVTPLSGLPHIVIDIPAA